jgi:hypothetical protein
LTVIPKIISARIFPSGFPGWTIRQKRMMGRAKPLADFCYDLTGLLEMSARVIAAAQSNSPFALASRQLQVRFSRSLHLRWC